MPKYHGDGEDTGDGGRKTTRRHFDDELEPKGGRRGKRAVIQPGHEGAHLADLAELGKAFGVKPDATPNPAPAAPRPAPQGVRPTRPAPQNEQPRQELESCPTCSGLKPVRHVNPAGVETHPLVCFECHKRYVAHVHAEEKKIASEILGGGESRQPLSKEEWLMKTVDLDGLAAEAAKAAEAETEMLKQVAKRLAEATTGKDLTLGVRGASVLQIRTELKADEVRWQAARAARRLKAAQQVVADLTAKATAGAEA